MRKYFRRLKHYRTVLAMQSEEIQRLRGELLLVGDMLASAEDELAKVRAQC